LTSLIANEIYFYVVVSRLAGGIAGRNMVFAEIPGYCYNDAGNKKILLSLFRKQNLRKRKGVKR
jgi:hypothetical protein